MGMTDLEKAARQALEVLEENHHLIEEHERPEYLAHYDRVISGVSKALEQTAQKRPPNCGTGYCSCIECVMEPEQPAQQEPVAKYIGEGNDGSLVQLYDDVEKGTELYTRPQAREPLTDEQRNWIVATCPTPRHIIDTVEKMHGIKGDA